MVYSLYLYLFESASHYVQLFIHTLRLVVAIADLGQN